MFLAKFFILNLCKKNLNRLLSINSHLINQHIQMIENAIVFNGSFNPHELVFVIVRLLSN